MKEEAGSFTIENEHAFFVKCQCGKKHAIPFNTLGYVRFVSDADEMKKWINELKE